ncbi:MAG: alpha-2-macroglobulin family protein, partial [Gammaproteobacteria bacterium]
MPYRIVLCLLMALQLLPAARAEPAQVEVFAPQGTVKGPRQVSVRFSRAMVRFGDPRLAEPFTIDCPEPGKGRWADARNWVYDFERDVPAGVRCRYTLKPRLTALSGQGFAGQQTFEFDTGGPNVLAALPYDGEEGIDEEQVFILAPDAPVAADSVAAQARCAIEGLAEQIEVEVLDGAAREAVLDERRALGYRYYRLLTAMGDEEDTEGRARAESRLVLLRCRRSLPPETSIRLIWGRGMRSASGLETATDQALTFKTRAAFTASFRCERVNAQADCIPIQTLRLSFSAPIAVQTAQRIRLVGAQGETYPFQTLDPATKPWIEDLEFSGPFPPRATLRVELPPELTDDTGRKLSNAARYPLEVKTDEYPPLAKVSGEFGIIEWKEGGILPVTVRNIEPGLALQRLLPAREAVNAR